MKSPKSPPYEPTVQDLQARIELKQALVALKGIPPEDMWSLVFEALPDWWHCYVLQSRQFESALIMERLMPFAIDLITVTARKEFVGDELRKTYWMTLQSIAFASGAEMERRNLKFCASVAPMPNPFLMFYDPDSFFQPKDPETFNLEELLDYYTDFCASAE